MDDKDRVFARFKDDKPEAPHRRELLTIPRRAGASGSRVVEVVHVRSGGGAGDRQQRIDTHVRAASWEAGFPAKPTVAAPPPLAPVPAVDAPAPTTHVMPAWQPAATVLSDTSRAEAPVIVAPRGRGRPRKQPAWEPTAAEVDPAVADAPIATSRRGRGRPRKTGTLAPARHVADPFNADDDGTNCMRCGYAIGPAREKRGLMTCAPCG